MINRLDVIVLGLLRARPRTGYDVRKWLGTYGRTIGYTAVPSQIYRQLARLEERGWAESVTDPRSSGPDGRLYSITDAGRDTFHEWATSEYEPVPRPMDPEFQVRMFFTQHLGPEALLRLVRTELSYRRAQHQHPSPYDPTILAEDAGADETAWAEEVYLLASERGRLLASVLITWLELTEARLDRLAASARAARPGRGDRTRDDADAADRTS
ncbi:PadR family transcriptional regulator [Cellulomonas sp. NS3]|uniref:PadR family transcriptional regulator n=1 Tax=Cellulomonas sp. NS3 TaxID=2973977 RepID=UPI002161AAA0|nr:PadR family transcriptional regulator [Cellulomonas sp. NS3]